MHADPGQSRKLPLNKHINKVSVHGGHSGQFCNHAKDTLEDVVRTYIDEGFTWVGITEHMPPPSDGMRYPDEAEAGISSATLLTRFHEYFNECRALRDKYRDQIQLFTAFETETYVGSSPFVRQLIEATRPDYIVGSVHHVAGWGIDYNRDHYASAASAAGGMDALYCAYFDAQYTMLEDLLPSVVGHFDLIRIFDPDYLQRLQTPDIQQRIQRNLSLIAQHDLILDFNLRGFDKTLEQYPCMPLLETALAMGIKVVPGDDSHGVSSVGRNYDRGVEILARLGANLDWPLPRLIQYQERQPS
jgi:histidinol-phosphatase (PHP family)